jgi:hypothetical protein
VLSALPCLPSIETSVAARGFRTRIHLIAAGTPGDAERYCMIRLIKSNVVQCN